MPNEWQCRYCKQWWSVRYRACTHAHIPRERDPTTGKLVTVLGAETEIWIAERIPEDARR